MTETAQKATEKMGLSGIASKLPLGRLKDEARGFGEAMTKQGLSKASERVDGLTGKLNDYAEGKSTATKMAANVAQGDSPAKAGVKAAASKVKDTVKEKLGFGGGGKGKIKVTNILESVDVPVSREVAYAQWTQFEDFPTFMKKVENVDQEEDERLKWRAQIFWSHRSWTSNIVDQVPNERIVWKSDGDKGSVDGAVTFHELAPDLTRVQIVLEYHPKGLFEHTGNLWRAQGRRARLELKHYARHVSTQTLLHQDELEGWPGTIQDGHVVEESDEDQEPQDQQEQGQEEGEEPEDQAAEEQEGSEEEGSEEEGSEDEEGSEEEQEEQEEPRKRSRTARSEQGPPAKKQAAKKAPARKRPAKKTASKATAG